MAYLHTEDQQSQNQRYDVSLKELVERQAGAVLPLLLPGVTYEETLNVEIVRPMMRTDKVVQFHFLILPLFELDAECYVREHVICMYPLLPTMQNVDHRLMKQAIDELAEAYCEDQNELADMFVFMMILLERTDTVSSVEKEKIKEALKMYHRLWEESPMVQRMKTEERVETLQDAIITVVKVRFPSLTDLARQKITQIDHPEKLSELHKQIVASPNEEIARLLLNPMVA